MLKSAMKMQWIALLLISCVIGLNASSNSTEDDVQTTQSRRKKHDSSDMSAEKRLVKRLLTTYHRIRQDGRPVHNDSTPVPVKFGLGLVQMELNEKDAVLVLSMWTRYQWKDDYMTWDPADYDSVTQVNLEKDNIWCPDIMLYNTADVAIEQRHALAVVNFEGLVTWYPHSIFRATCSIDIANYPFDEQRCYLAFGSWTHNSQEIDLDMGFPGGIDLSTFNNDAQESSSWQILNVTASKNYMPSPEEHPNFAVLTFEVHMRRRVVFSSYILTLPCIFLASLTLVVFMLPPERPDRIGLAMAVFSSFMVLLLILVEAAPPTAASVPRLGVYYCFNMVIIVMAVIISSAIVNISRGNGKPVPPCLQGALLLISKLLLMSVTSLRCCCCPERGPSITSLICCCCWPKKSSRLNSTTSPALRLSQQHPAPKGCGICTEAGGGRLQHNDHVELHNVLSSGSSESGVVDVVRQIRVGLQQKEEQENRASEARKSSERMAMQWKETAQILDRFIFVLYLVLMTVSLSFFFPKPFTE